LRSAEFKILKTAWSHTYGRQAKGMAQSDEFKAESSSLKGQRKTIYWAIGSFESS
jgi:hypothetical protein